MREPSVTGFVTTNAIPDKWLHSWSEMFELRADLRRRQIPGADVVFRAAIPIKSEVDCELLLE